MLLLWAQQAGDIDPLLHGTQITSAEAYNNVQT